MESRAAEGTVVAIESQANTLHAAVRDHIHRYPYLSVAVGAGIGYVVGSGLRSPQSRRLLGAIGSLALFSPIWSRLIGAGVTLFQPRRS